jgi:hypothetical protein
VLFRSDITPNITVWREMNASLEYFLSSLKKVKQYDCEQGLSAHRGASGDLAKRADELLEAHEARLQNVLDIVRKQGKATAYQVASQMKWSIDAKTWDDFPLPQKWFAVGEAIAHLYYLADHDQLERINERDVCRYALR